VSGLRFPRHAIRIALTESTRAVHLPAAKIADLWQRQIARSSAARGRFRSPPRARLLLRPGEGERGRTRGRRPRARRLVADPNWSHRRSSLTDDSCCLRSVRATRAVARADRLLGANPRRRPAARGAVHAGDRASPRPPLADHAALFLWRRCRCSRTRSMSCYAGTQRPRCTRSHSSGYGSWSQGRPGAGAASRCACAAGRSRRKNGTASSSSSWERVGGCAGDEPGAEPRRGAKCGRAPSPVSSRGRRGPGAARERA
jgi:hypothetical protein